MSEPLNNLIADIAKAICISLHIDPNLQVGHGYLDAKTDEELVTWAKSNTGVPLVEIYSPQWCLYRKQAARMIAERKIAKQFEERIDAQIKQEA